VLTAERSRIGERQAGSHFASINHGFAQLQAGAGLTPHHHHHRSFLGVEVDMDVV
jgi:hypothetical protein